MYVPDLIDGKRGQILKKIDAQTLVQLIGMGGVIFSLIFVGLEMRQSQRIALAAQNTPKWLTLGQNLSSNGDPAFGNMEPMPTAFILV